MSRSKHIRVPVIRDALSFFSNKNETHFTLLMKEAVRGPEDRLCISFELQQVQVGKGDDGITMKDRAIRYDLARSKRATMEAFEAMLDTLWVLEMSTQSE